jgi:hypothetical protein
LNGISQDSLEVSIMPEPAIATKPPAAAYKQPSVSPGDMVLWSFHKGNEQVVGLVTANTGGTLNLTLFGDGSSGLRTVRGARHVSDPMLRTMVEAPGGVWDYTESTRKIQQGLIT